MFKNKINVFTNKDTVIADVDREYYKTAETMNIETIKTDNIDSFREQVKQKVDVYYENLLVEENGNFAYVDALDKNLVFSDEYKNFIDGDLAARQERINNDLDDKQVYVSNVNDEHEDANNIHKTKIGLNVGAGVDFVIKERFIVGVEYKFSQVKMYGLNIPSHTVGLKLGVQFL